MHSSVLAFFRKNYEITAFFFLHVARLQDGDVVCDIGANIGYYSLLAAPIVGKAGKVVAITPFLATLKILKHNVKLNDADNVGIVQAAVSARIETSTPWWLRRRSVEWPCRT